MKPEEIKRATFDLGAKKAPGPDGFLIAFFQKFWDIVKSVLARLCEDFCDGKANLECINWASIALIPKVETTDSPTDLRSSLTVSLCARN